MSSVYNRAKYLLMNGGLDLDTDDIRLLLVDADYTFDADHDYVSDVVAEELSGTGYTRKNLASETVTLDDTNDWGKFTAAAVTWTGINAGTAKAAIIYKFVSADADSPLIAYLDGTGFPVTTNGGDLTLTPHTNGLITLS